MADGFGGIAFTFAQKATFLKHKIAIPGSEKDDTAETSATILLYWIVCNESHY